MHQKMSKYSISEDALQLFRHGFLFEGLCEVVLVVLGILAHVGLAMFICCFGGSLVVFVPLAFSQDGLVLHLHCTVLSTLT